MKVSVVVVGCNMCKQLRKSLNALTEATQSIDSEIIVVDNGSTDKTVETVMREFPAVRITTLENNNGLSKAINQGIRLAKGEYLLLVKPDIIVEHDSVSKSINFMDEHVTSGGLGARILDHYGNYLPESKKVLPNAWVTFFKLTGLAKQFPKSRLTASFVKHHEDEFETTETDVLNDKFMLIRKSVLDNIGLFDERFTNYGGNIDISYRIRLAGFKNYYFPKTHIIDQQTQAATKFSLAYLKIFYGSMIIFAIKYFFSLPAVHVKPLQELYPAYELKG